MSADLPESNDGGQGRSGDDAEGAAEPTDPRRWVSWARARNTKARASLVEARALWSEWRTVQKERATYRVFEASPGGRARIAAGRGDTFFQHDTVLGGDEESGAGSDPGTAISAIEAEGWRLDSTDFVTETTVETVTEEHRTATTNRTQVRAIYQFSRRSGRGPTDDLGEARRVDPRA